MALTTTYWLQGASLMGSGERGVMRPWVPTITMPGQGSTEPTNITRNGSKFCVIDGVFYGHLSLQVASNSDLGQGPHWELWLPHRRYTTGSRMIGNGLVWKTSDLKNHAWLQIVGYGLYDTIASVQPILPYYSAARMDYAADPDYLYEPMMEDGSGGSGTQARVEATKPAWQNIATDWSNHAQQAMNISAHIKYNIKQ